MKRITFIVALLVMMALTADAKLIMVRVKQILDEATAIRMVRIYGYKDSVMLYGYLNSKDTLTVDCKRKEDAEYYWKFMTEHKHMAPGCLAGKWPEAQEKVLMVLKQGKVKLFAKVKGDDYRFWDPNCVFGANSVFEFPKEPPFKPLLGCDNMIVGTGAWVCSDGCLVTAAALKER